MQRFQGQNNLTRATETAAGTGRGLGRAPPSPAIPPKRAKVTAEHGDPAAPVFLQKLKDVAVSIGHDIQLRVVVTGSPRPHLRWYKEKELIAPIKEKDEGEEEYGSFWICNCKEADAGAYSCMAKNEHGEAVTSATVTITDMEGRNKVGHRAGWVKWWATYTHAPAHYQLC